MDKETQEQNDTQEVKEEVGTSDNTEVKDQKPDEQGLGENASEETVEEPEEELIPMSKVQERFDQMTAQIKKLEQEKNEIFNKFSQMQVQPQKTNPFSEYSDEDVNYVITHPEQYETSQVMEAIKEKDRRLEEKIEKKFIQKYEQPIKLQQVQIEWFKKAVDKFGKDLLDINSPLRQKAEEIFASNAEYKTKPEGQYLAVMEAYVDLNKGSSKKVNLLKKKLKKEQKKTQLSSGNRSVSGSNSGGTRQARLDKLEQEAFKSGKGSKAWIAWLRELNKSE